MAMTKRKAERITGYDIRQLRQEQGRITFGAFRGNQLVAEATHSFDEFALDALVQKIYAIHSREVLSGHRWSCARCGRSGPLQVHHRRYRSHGGTHNIENLEPVCWNCHRMIHRTERSQ